MGDKEKKILGGLALAALILGTGGAGAGLAGAAEGAGAAAGAAGAEGAAAGLTAAEGAAAAEGAGALSNAELLALESEGVNAGAAGSLGGAGGAEPAAGALGEGAGAPLGAQTYTPEELLRMETTSKPPIDFAKFMSKAGERAGNTAVDMAVASGIRQAMTPNVTTYGHMPFSPYQAAQMQPMRLTNPQAHLRSLGFA